MVLLLGFKKRQGASAAGPLLPSTPLSEHCPADLGRGPILRTPDGKSPAGLQGASSSSEPSPLKSCALRCLSSGAA